MVALGADNFDEDARRRRSELIQQANGIRVKRSELAREIRSGAVSIEQIITEPSEYIRTALVLDLLATVPTIGLLEGQVLLSACGIPNWKTVGGLSESKRRELVSRIAD